MREFKREKYFKEIVEAPNFKFVHYIRNGKRRTKLLVFPNGIKDKCYEYFWNCGNKLYTCGGCVLKIGYISARHVKTAEKEFIELLSTEHACELRNYTPEKYGFDPSKQIIKSPNFKVFNYTQFGISKSTMVVFLSENKQFCHEYHFDKASNGYFCNGCKCIKNEMKAVIQKDEENGEDFVTIYKPAHSCKPRKYDPEKFTDDIILQKPMFKVIEERVMGKSSKKLLIFTSKEQKFCYKFRVGRPYFTCIKCGTEGKYLRAILHENEEGNEYVAVRNTKHLCEPIEYSVADFEEKKIVQKPNYQIIEKRNGSKNLVKTLIVFDENDKNLYYEYTWNIRRKKSGFFRCSRCKPFKINVQANLLHNKEYGEYIELGKNLHKCQPKKYISEGLTAKIVNIPDFEERTIINPHGLEKKILIVFHSTDKSLCYIYYFLKGYGYYICNGCAALKSHVSAKLFTNETGEKYVELTANKKHICKPKTYEPQGFAGKIIKAPFFEHKHFYNRYKKMTAKLVVYCNDEKTEYYEYIFDSSAKKFLCEKCKKMKKNTFAKLKKNEEKDEKEFVELGPRNHFCEPCKKLR